VQQHVGRFPGACGARIDGFAVALEDYSNGVAESYAAAAQAGQALEETCNVDGR
jgi:hypothetical protein